MTEDLAQQAAIYRSRAAEVRASAYGIDDAASREALHRIANAYDELAARLEARLWNPGAP